MGKYLIIIFLLSCLRSCAIERSIQVDMVIAEIIAMEPYYRNSEEAGCKITWRDTYNNVKYTSFSHAPEYCDNYIVGVRYRLLIHK